MAAPGAGAPGRAEDGGEIDGRNETKGSVAVDMRIPDGGRRGLKHNAQCRLTSCNRVFGGVAAGYLRTIISRIWNLQRSFQHVNGEQG